METRISCFSSEIGYYLNSIMIDGKARSLSISAEPRYREGEDDVTSEVRRYLSGKMNSLSHIPIDPKGTEFQKKVWMELRGIPRGEVSTYSEIAHRVGSPNASRAVGNAVASNPLLLLVPCHRVVAKHGLGGFSAEGGLETKRELLEIEGVFPAKMTGLRKRGSNR